MKRHRLLKNRPIALAIALSLLLHAALLLGPVLVIPSPVELPPLTARLEPLPAKKPEPEKLHQKKTRKPHPKRVIESLPKAAPIATVQKSPLEAPAASSSAEKPTQEIPHEKPVEKPANPLPRHAELTFIVYMGTDMRIGEVRHRLDIDKSRYTLEVGINTTGLARFFKTFDMHQKSMGAMDEGGFRPEEFSEEKLTSKGMESSSAEFDWKDKLIKFSNGSNAPLPEKTQDILSVLYQLSQMPLDQPRIALHVSNGKKLESYEVEVGPEENVQTKMGLLRAILLRKIRDPDEEGLKIWLGLDYRLLPVKVQQLDKKDRVIGEIDVSEIRVSDDNPSADPAPTGKIQP